VLFFLLLGKFFFFFSFFWGFFHSSLAPSPIIGNVWPPKGVPLPSSLGWPLLGTVILLTSRLFVTYRHRQVRKENKVSKWSWTPWINFQNRVRQNLWFHFLNQALVFNNKEVESWNQRNIKLGLVKEKCLGMYFNIRLYKFKTVIYFLNFNSGISYKAARWNLLTTWVIGLIFLWLQRYEYSHLGFNINRGVYGSCFYLITGFHGLHVILGVIFLIVQWKRIKRRHFSIIHHVGLEAAVWYWHFVDVVWLGLYLGVYCWGNWSP